MIVTSEFELNQVAAPNLPLAPTAYEPRYQDQVNNVLRLYFNRLDAILAQLRTSDDIDPSNVNFPNGLFFNTADQTLAAINTGYPITFNQTYLNNFVALQVHQVLVEQVVLLVHLVLQEVAEQVVQVVLQELRVLAEHQVQVVVQVQAAQVAARVLQA